MPAAVLPELAGIVTGNWAQDATKSYTRTENAQDAQDANLISLASGCKTSLPDVPQIFTNVSITLLGNIVIMKVERETYHVGKLLVLRFQSPEV